MLLNILVGIAFIIFIIAQVYDIVKTHRFFKRAEAEHKQFIESLKGCASNDESK